MEKYRMCYTNGNYDDFYALNDNSAKNKVNTREYQGDILLYKYSASKSVFEPWEHVATKSFRGVTIHYEWLETDPNDR